MNASVLTRGPPLQLSSFSFPFPSLLSRDARGYTDTRTNKLLLHICCTVQTHVLKDCAGIAASVYLCSETTTSTSTTTAFTRCHTRGSSRAFAHFHRVHAVDSLWLVYILYTLQYYVHVLYVSFVYAKTTFRHEPNILAITNQYWNNGAQIGTE